MKPSPRQEWRLVETILRAVDESATFPQFRRARELCNYSLNYRQLFEAYKRVSRSKVQLKRIETALTIITRLEQSAT